MILTPEIQTRIRDKTHIPDQQWRALLDNASGNAFELAKELLAQGWVERDVIGMALAETFAKAYINLGKTLFQQQCIEKLPKKFAQQLEAIPLYQFGQAVTVAMTEPTNDDKIRQLQVIIGAPVDCLFSFKDEIESAISVYYQTQDLLTDLSSNINVSSLKKLNEPTRLQAYEIVELSSSLIFLALKERASDIHFQPRKNEFQIRFRVDGVLNSYLSFSREIGQTLISRYKIMSQMDISEKRKPQDGRMVFETPVKNIDVRVSCLPALYGEKIVMRLLGAIHEAIPLNLDKLNIEPEVLIPFKQVLRKPNGLILVTGPTGSGKSTTLYAALNFMNSPDQNIITIEDPVEYEVANFTQVPVDDKSGRSFQKVLRSALRQDPDVILVGETRDQETAAIAAQAALTGHLVLTTLHTSSALQAVTRLLDMGVLPYVLSPTLAGIVAQRLVRKICTHCKEEYQPSTSYLQQFFHWQRLPQLPKLFQGRGCKHCGNTGYSGRIGIHEFLLIDPALRSLIAHSAPYDELQAYLNQSGHKDLRYDGFKKALQGHTTLDEVLRVTSCD